MARLSIRHPVFLLLVMSILPGPGYGQDQDGMQRQHMGRMQCMQQGKGMMEKSEECKRHRQHRQDGEHEHSMHGMGSGDHAMEHAGGAGAADEPGTPSRDFNESRESVQGLYTASVETELDPLIINRMHSWTLHLETRDGQPLDNAEISISGGMPGHGHGLPTAPRVTRELGHGDYLVEGMQFQMPGHWQVRFDISKDGHSDRIIFDFTL